MDWRDKFASFRMGLHVLSKRRFAGGDSGQSLWHVSYKNIKHAVESHVIHGLFSPDLSIRQKTAMKRLYMVMSRSVRAVSAGFGSEIQAEEPDAKFRRYHAGEMGVAAVGTICHMFARLQASRWIKSFSTHRRR